jgi:hypothetical protein
VNRLGDTPWEISVAMFFLLEKEGKGDAAPFLVDVQFTKKKTSRILFM